MTAECSKLYFCVSRLVRSRQAAAFSRAMCIAA